MQVASPLDSTQTNLPYDAAGNVVASRSQPKNAGFGVANAYQAPRGCRCRSGSRSRAHAHGTRGHLEAALLLRHAACGPDPAAGFGSAPSLSFLGYQSPNEKLNIAGIGAGAQAFNDLRGCETENIVALADVDWLRGEPGFQRYDKAAKYKDYRQMLDKEGKSIDAVVIGIRTTCTRMRRSGAWSAARACMWRSR